jgi:hypothetical protein
LESTARSFHRENCLLAACHDYSDVETHEIRSEVRHAVGPALGPSILDLDILPFDVTQLAKAGPQAVGSGVANIRRGGSQ